MNKMRWGIACALVFVAHTASVAQNYPQKPVRFVVPYSAGGAGNIFARAIGQKQEGDRDVRAGDQGSEHTPRVKRGSRIED